MSNMGKWRGVYTERRFASVKNTGGKMGGSASYQRASEFFSDVGYVEDWGCGLGAFKAFLPEGTTYIGIDGTSTPFVDQIEDLELYQSKSEGIILRHVLAHNPEWQTVLYNALNSFQRKLCVIIFTPWTDETSVIHTARLGGSTVPVISFKREDIINCIEAFPNVTYVEETINNPKSDYNEEHIFYIKQELTM